MVETHRKGGTYTIEWDKGNGGTHVKIQLLKSNKHNKWISKKTKNDGKYVWKVPASVATGSAYKIKITSIKNKKVFDKSNKNFTISNTLNVASPNNGKENWNTGSTYTIKWNKGDIKGNVKIELLKSGKFYLKIHNNTKNDGRYAWVIPSAVKTGSAYKIKITSIKNKKVFYKSNRNFAIARKNDLQF